MEKKVPERKVSLKDSDIFYVYDKRINRCIREDCEGNVKYGLVLKVNVSPEDDLNKETINCFECNKCHMKYTPYPNYVRLSKPEILHIYNQDEVTARDKKRAEDALKQAARERHKYTGKPYGKKSYEKKPYERKNYEKKPYDKKFEKRPYEKDDAVEKPYGERKNFEGRKPFDKAKSRTYDQNAYGKKPYYDKGENTYGQKRYTKKPYSRENQDGDKKTDPKRGGYYKRNVQGQNGAEKRKTGIFITTGNYNRKPYQKDERKD